MLQRSLPPLGTAVAKLSRQRIFERPGPGKLGLCARPPSPEAPTVHELCAAVPNPHARLSTIETHEKDRTNDPEGIL
jgi:hypothetical protein